MSDAAESAAEPAAESADGAPTVTFGGRAMFWLPIAPIVALDLWSKAAVFSALDSRFPHLPPQSRRIDFDFLPEPFGFSLVQWRNTGTIWGLGQDLTIGLIALRLVALAVILWFVRRTESRLQQLVLGLIFAGAVGNLYDNLFMPSSGVRDFLLFYFKGDDGVVHSFPAFNVADSCICVGAIALAVILWRQDVARNRGARAAPATAPDSAASDG